jgi:hypothetical protein
MHYTLQHNTSETHPSPGGKSGDYRSSLVWLPSTAMHIGRRHNCTIISLGWLNCPLQRYRTVVNGAGRTTSSTSMTLSCLTITPGLPRCLLRGRKNAAALADTPQCTRRRTVFMQISKHNFNAAIDANLAINGFQDFVGCQDVK